jgi:3-deoxy-D-manno-octulosonate 8-phosphate phosphatase (KDO 8-P phosphatase)
MSTPEALSSSDALGVRIQFVAFDFDGVFTDNTVFVDRTGGEWVRCWRGDGLGLQRLRELAIPAMVLSTEINEVVSRRCEKLGIGCRQGLANKGEELMRVLLEAGVDLEATAYVGNDVNDRECLQMVGVPIVVADAHPDVMAIARYQTTAPGGRGAVREVCDWIASHQPPMG